MIAVQELDENNQLIDVKLSPKQYALGRLHTAMVTYSEYWEESHADEVKAMTEKEKEAVSKAINSLADRVYKMIAKAGG